MHASLELFLAFRQLEKAVAVGGTSSGVPADTCPEPWVDAALSIVPTSCAEFSSRPSLQLSWVLPLPASSALSWWGWWRFQVLEAPGHGLRFAMVADGEVAVASALGAALQLGAVVVVALRMLQQLPGADWDCDQCSALSFSDALLDALFDVLAAAAQRTLLARRKNPHLKVTHTHTHPNLRKEGKKQKWSVQTTCENCASFGWANFFGGGGVRRLCSLNRMRDHSRSLRHRSCCLGACLRLEDLLWVLLRFRIAHAKVLPESRLWATPKLALSGRSPRPVPWHSVSREFGVVDLLWTILCLGGHATMPTKVTIDLRTLPWGSRAQVWTESAAPRA